MKISFNVNGLIVDAEYSETEVEELFIPLLKQIALLRTDKDLRLIVYLAAPPGSGKTTLSQFLEILYQKQDLPHTFKAISMDGFHYNQEYLMNYWTEVDGEKMQLNSVKGSPESFDLNALKKKIEALTNKDTVQWPVYDRNLHDVSKENVLVDADIVLIEGNYLLLDEPCWNELQDLADLTVFIDANEERLKPRLIERKMMGGLSLDQATAFYEQSDRRNVLRVLEHSGKSDVRLMMTEGRKFKKI